MRIIVFFAVFGTLIQLPGLAQAQSPAQLRPQFQAPLPPTFVPPAGTVAPSRGPAIFPFVAPIGGSFENGAQMGLVTRRGQSLSTYAGPGYGGFQIQVPTRIGGR